MLVVDYIFKDICKDFPLIAGEGCSVLRDQQSEPDGIGCLAGTCVRFRFRTGCADCASGNEKS